MISFGSFIDYWFRHRANSHLRTPPHLRVADGHDGGGPLCHHESDGPRRYQDDDDLCVPREEPHERAGREAQRYFPDPAASSKNESPTSPRLCELRKIRLSDNSKRPADHRLLLCCMRFPPSTASPRNPFLTPKGSCLLPNGGLPPRLPPESPSRNRARRRNHAETNFTG